MQSTEDKKTSDCDSRTVERGVVCGVFGKKRRQTARESTNDGYVLPIDGSCVDIRKEGENFGLAVVTVLGDEMSESLGRSSGEESAMGIMGHTIGERLKIIVEYSFLIFRCKYIINHKYIICQLYLAMVVGDGYTEGIL